MIVLCVWNQNQIRFITFRLVFVSLSLKSLFANSKQQPPSSNEMKPNLRSSTKRLPPKEPKVAKVFGSSGHQVE